MKRFFKIITVIILCFILGFALICYTLFIGVDNVRISYQSIISNKIPNSMNNKKIAYFSDITYLEFMDKGRLQNMISTLNEAHADIVIFGGDIFSDPVTFAPDSKSVKELTEILSSIEAPLGKFAVYGDQDIVNDETKKIVTNILTDSEFEIISNSNIQLRNETPQGITLVGLDPLVNGTVDTNTAFKNITKDDFTILVSHCPDIMTNTSLNTNYIDIAVAGHSLGGQIYIPIYGPIEKQEGASTYFHGTYEINTTTLYVSNGLGTRGSDLRIFSPPEIFLFRLQSKES